MKPLLFKIFLAAVLFSYRAEATIHGIMVINNTFNPSSLTVQAGDTVRWIWFNGTHTTTSTTIPTGAAAWNAPITSSSMAYLYVPTIAGTYNYVCSIHQGMGMTGSFVVTGSLSLPSTSAAMFSVSPNPVKDIIRLSGVKDNGIVSLTDIGGHSIELPLVSSSNGERHYSTANIAAGIYFLFVEGDRQRELVKVVKE